MKKLLLITAIAAATATPAIAQWSDNPAENVQISAEAVYDWDSRMLSDGSFVVYYNRPSRTVIYGDTIFSRKHVLMRYNSDGTPAWSEPLTVANTPNLTYTVLRNKYLLTDDEDCIYVNIVDCRYDTFGTPWGKMSLTVHKINKAGVQMWGDTGVSTDKNGHDVISLSNAIVLENGSLVLSWLQQDYLSGSSTASTTKIARISSAGEVLWVNNLSPEGHATTLVNGGNSQFIVVYLSGADPFSNTSICAQKMNTNGEAVFEHTVLYDAGGFKLRVIPDLEVLPVERGAIVSWYADPDGDSYEDAYCSYINRSGVLAFANGPSGLKLGNQPGRRRFLPAGVYDKVNKHIYYTWRESTGDEKSNSIVGQKINLNGELLWNEDGVIIAPMFEWTVDYPSVQIDSAGNPCFFYMENPLQKIKDSLVTGYAQKHSSVNGDCLWKTTFTTFSSPSKQLKTRPYTNSQWIATWAEGGGVGGNGYLYAQNIREDGTLGNGSGISVAEELPALLKSTSNKNFSITANPTA
ncbi:MAG: hypothetical protein LBG17_09595, partial [Bacteroidales bacterium]|nr:hypothetical protein [Bacteroidales bacterium]